MVYNLYGIIMGFIYLGDLLNVKLVEGYYLIFLSSFEKDSVFEVLIFFFEVFSKVIILVICWFFMLGKCVYIEIVYFGGIGI